ncbi:acyltransferase [Bythopirellula goksoeyrii]|uniref:Acetyltransferase n=1 Tax=Bythopirellula goksoeyrii TaxID=1400387 RepID=A0A5B9QAX2_9BACT|nr:acyltransferase [Bythopirellula goksoeyrii]QEG36177.1 Putative acetyltransferase [Bythopirellula goksoeyrii]
MRQGGNNQRRRLAYQRWSPVLQAGVVALRVCPRFLCNALLSLVRHLPTTVGMALRYMLVARLCHKCGSCVAIFEGVYLHNLSQITLGDNVSIHPMCYIEGAGGLEIGCDVSIAHGVSILTTEHDFAQPGIATRDAPIRFGSVVVESDVWLGCGVRVLAGATIQRGAVVGAGAVVKQSVPAHSVAVGVPARVVRSSTKPSPACTHRAA